MELNIDGRVFKYEEENLSHDTIQPITEQNARIIIHLVNSLLNELGIDYCLAFGSLLGAIRDHGLIKGDEDVDIVITDENALYKALPYLDEKGLHLIRRIEGKLYSFRVDENAYIDMYVMNPIKKSIWGLYCIQIVDLYMPKSYFRKYETIEFLGEPVRCPKNPERLLKFWYGSTWRTPVRGHKFRYEVATHYYWTRIVLPLLKKYLPFFFKNKR